MDSVSNGHESTQVPTPPYLLRCPQVYHLQVCTCVRCHREGSFLVQSHFRWTKALFYALKLPITEWDRDYLKQNNKYNIVPQRSYTSPGKYPILSCIYIIFSKYSTMPEWPKRQNQKHFYQCHTKQRWMLDVGWTLHIQGRKSIFGDKKDVFERVQTWNRWERKIPERIKKSKGNGKGRYCNERKQFRTEYIELQNYAKH